MNSRAFYVTTFAAVLTLIVYVSGCKRRTPETSTTTVTTETTPQTSTNATVTDNSSAAGSAITTEEVADQMRRTGQVVVNKVEPVTNAVEDAMVTSAIKAKLVADPELSALSINVDTNGGRVTLRGSVATYDLVAKAMRLALETNGVREVTSALQVTPIDQTIANPS